MRKADKTLVRDGDLRSNLTYRTGRYSVEIDSPSGYAGAHRFGALRGVFGTAGGPIP